jgi:hypothetical protein
MGFLGINNAEPPRANRQVEKFILSNEIFLNIITTMRKIV